MPAATDIVNPDALNSTIEFLTAMVTPALLISATGSLVLSTSTRLGRVVDRVRQLEERLSDLIYAENKDGRSALRQPCRGDRRSSRQGDQPLANFAACDGDVLLRHRYVHAHERDDRVAAFFNTYRWVPIPIGIVGIMFLFWGSMLDAPRNANGDRDGQCRDGFHMAARPQRSRRKT